MKLFEELRITVYWGLAVVIYLGELVRWRYWKK